MPKFEDQLEMVYASDRTCWRQWLEQNHQQAIGVWLVYYKIKSGKLSVQYSEAVKEALCFGWIDSKVQSLDEERYRQIFTPRKPKSVWSKLNKQYVEELIFQGKMTEAGLAKIAVAKENGSWTSLDEIEALIVPPDLKQALEADETANKNFAAFNNSTKKSIFQWIQSAKSPETRLNRIVKTVSSAAQNNNPLKG
jgi:uncharacterized protein YdeI (YjbR/CyaY-like superfamily)